MIIDFNSVGSTSPAASETKKKTQSQFWLNVGLLVDGKHITLPRGIALDELEAKAIPNSSTKNPEFRNLRIREAKLWQKMQEVMATLEPGQEVELPFVCRLRKVSATESVEDITTDDCSIGDFEVKRVG
jgi:hypothetical protein